MTDYDLSDLGSMEPQQFAKMVKETPTDQIKAVLQGELRGKILGEIFGRMPALFRADRAGSTSAVIHWNLGDRADGGTDTYELVIADGTCTLSPEPSHEPKLALTVPAVEFVKIVSGNANPMMMFMTGKLKAKGDLGLAANIPNLFDIPKP
jgi:putative sterol carrier protein